MGKRPTQIQSCSGALWAPGSARTIGGQYPVCCQETVSWPRQRLMAVVFFL